MSVFWEKQLPVWMNTPLLSETLFFFFFSTVVDQVSSTICLYSLVSDCGLLSPLLLLAEYISAKCICVLRPECKYIQRFICGGTFVVLSNVWAFFFPPRASCSSRSAVEMKYSSPLPVCLSAVTLLNPHLLRPGGVCLAVQRPSIGLLYIHIYQIQF